MCDPNVDQQLCGCGLPNTIIPLNQYDSSEHKCILIHSGGIDKGDRTCASFHRLVIEYEKDDMVSGAYFHASLLGAYGRRFKIYEYRENRWQLERHNIPQP